MSSIKTSIANGQMKVVSPYNTTFVAGAKNLAGKWAAPAWVFDARNETAVRALLTECYGSDGTGTEDVVSIRVKMNPDCSVYNGPITIGGRIIARAFGRDSGAKLGEGVVVLSGGFDSAGSVKNWRTAVKDGTEVLLHEFPRAAAERLIAEGNDVTIVHIEPPTIDVDALRAERERLMDRVGKIDAILASQGA